MHKVVQDVVPLGARPPGFDQPEDDAIQLLECPLHLEIVRRGKPGHERHARLEVTRLAIDHIDNPVQFVDVRLDVKAEHRHAGSTEREPSHVPIQPDDFLPGQLGPLVNQVRRQRIDPLIEAGKVLVTEEGLDETALFGPEFAVAGRQAVAQVLGKHPVVEGLFGEVFSPLRQNMAHQVRMVNEIQIGQPAPENKIPVFAQQVLKAQWVAHDRPQFVKAGR